MLPDTFQFSQAKLQDYADCARRFQLRYVLMQPWPALITQPADEAEAQMQRAADFHHMAHQHAVGLEAGQLAARIRDPILAQWWQTYLDRPPPNLPTALRRAEATVASPLGGYRLVAKFDLLAVEPGRRLVVVDWKTMLRRPTRATLARRLQTRVYRFLAAEAGAAFNGGQLPEPEQVEMVYWLAGAGGATETFPYDAGQHAADRASLSELIDEIATCQESTWTLTSDIRLCRFCNYRSLCERGVTAGFLPQLEDELESSQLEIDLEQIAEIEF